ncbi:hypothetical protein Tco_1216897 [Tanacetum coccineum]
MSRPHHRSQSRLEDAKRVRLNTSMHPGRLHGQMRKKLGCVKVGFSYLKIDPNVTRGRTLDFELRFNGTLSAKQRHPVVERSPKWMDIEVPNFASKHQASMRYKTSGSGSFNKEDKAKGLKKKGSRSSGSSSSTNDKGLARLIVSELAMHNERAIEMKKEERLAFLEIKRREVECRERELAMQEYQQRQEDIRQCTRSVGLESVSIRHIQGIGYGVLEFLGVGTTFDIFQNILFPYSLNTAYCLSWIRRIGLVSFVVFGECRHGYAVSSLMDMAYWLSE